VWKGNPLLSFMEGSKEASREERKTHAWLSQVLYILVWRGADSQKVTEACKAFLQLWMEISLFATDHTTTLVDSLIDIKCKHALASKNWRPFFCIEFKLADKIDTNLYTCIYTRVPASYPVPTHHSKACFLCNFLLPATGSRTQNKNCSVNNLLHV